MALQIVRPDVPQVGHRDPETRRELARLRQYLDGFLRSVYAVLTSLVDEAPIRGSVTLAASPATTTVIANARIKAATSRGPFLAPTTIAAAAALPSVYRSALVDGQITLTHLASAATRTFDYAILP